MAECGRGVPLGASVLLLAASLLVLQQGAAAARPAPQPADTAAFQHPEAIPWTGGAQKVAAQYSRRQLQLQHVPAARAAADAAPLAGAGAGHGPKESEAAEGAPAATAGAAAAEAAEDGEAAEKHVGLMCSFQLEQLLAELAGRGIRLAPQAQQEAALAALVADVEQLATRIVSSTSAAVAALHQKLAAHMPQQATHADMAALLVDSGFQEQLKDARDDALLAATNALEPLLPAFAQRVHSALAALVQAPDALEPLPAFTDSSLPPLAQAFTSSLVEATLLHPLWRD